MGIDFTAVIGHHFTAADLAQGAKLLTTIEESLRALEEHCKTAPETWQSRFPPSDSELNRQFRERLFLYTERGGLGVAIGHRSMKVHHVCRWRYFASHANTANLLRQLCHDFALWAGTN